MNRLAVLLLLVSLISCQKKEYDTIVRGATVYDGTGKAGEVMDVAILTDTIAAMGDLTNATSRNIVDGKGLVMAPGFIDAHSHHDGRMFEMRGMPACVSQGITTIVVGQDGGSHFPLSEYFSQFEATPVAVNVASYSGHNTLRDSVLGSDFKRHSTDVEIERMKGMLMLDMKAGALGLSTGLEYDPGIFSDLSEVVALAKVARQFNGRYISHVRSEDRYFWKAIDEIIEIGRQADLPVQISHIKLAMKSLWGKSDRLLSKLDSARETGIEVTADIYPYTFWHSTMTVLFPARNFKDRKESEFALTQITSPEGVLIGRYSLDSTYVGKTLAEISVLRKTDPPQTLMDLISEVEQKNGDESIIASSMVEDDIAKLVKWPNTGICSDGSGFGRHPRGYGTFPKVLRQFVREEKILAWEEAIQKMTSLTADNLGIEKRGRIKVGYYADLVLFNPDKISDMASPQMPQQPSVGIERVWVNGVVVHSAGKSTDKYPGQVIRRSVH